MDNDQRRLLDEVFALLEAGAADPASPFHVLTLGTLANPGPRLRSVILRGVDRARGRLTIHTDARSPKVGEIEAEPAVELHVWDADSRRQLRLTGHARLSRQDARASAEWASLGEHTRQTYQVGAAPSSVLHAAPPDQSLAEAAAVFTVIDVTIAAIEHLQLAREGNRRVLFTLPDRAEWLIA